MRIKIKLLVYCATCLNISWAQSAMDYFHSSANNYVDEKDVAARNVIDEGLRHYPDDPNLNSLSGRIKIPKPKLNQQQQQSQGQQQENEGEKKEEQQEQKQSEQSEQEQREQQEKEQQELAQEDPEKQQDLQHAQAILDALKKDEKVNQKRQMAKVLSKKLEKDW